MDYSFIQNREISKKRYRQTKLVGEGSYGKVFKAIDTKNHDVPVAIKSIKTDIGQDGFPASALREIAMFRELKHPNICKLNDVLWDIEGDNSVHLVMEWMEKDLAKFIDSQNDHISMFKIQSIMV